MEIEQDISQQNSQIQLQEDENTNQNTNHNLEQEQENSEQISESNNNNEEENDEEDNEEEDNRESQNQQNQDQQSEQINNTYNTDFQNNNNTTQKQSDTQLTQQQIQQQKDQQQQINQEKQKENMEQTIKQIKQKTDYIEKLLEKGSEVVILQYGSDTIKFGLANQKYPSKIKNQLAYRIKNKRADQTENRNQNRKQFEVSEGIDQTVYDMDDHLRLKGNFKAEVKQQKIKLKSKVELDFKKKIQLKSEEDIEYNLWEQDVVFEDEIYLIEGNDDWIIKRPIKYGFFNMNEGKESLHSVTEDLERLTRYILEEKMKIQISNLQNYKVILVVPDIFQREQISSLTNMLLRNLRFSALYMHLESVLATYGSCLGSACVVDVGFQKTNICCVEEGLILQNTVIRKNYGGEDLDNMFYTMLTKRHSALFKKKGLKLDSTLYSDMNSLSRVKEKLCSMIQFEDNSNRIYDVNSYRNGQEEIYNIFHNESVYLAPQSIFYHPVLNSIDKFTEKSRFYYDFMERYFDLYWDHEDYLEDVTGGRPNGIQTKFQQLMQQQKQEQMNNTNKLENSDQQQEPEEKEEKQEIEEEKQQLQQQQLTLQEQQQQLIVQQQQQVKKPRKKKGQSQAEQLQQQQEFLAQQKRQLLMQNKKKVQHSEILDPFKMHDLDIIIAHSIAQCNDLDTQKKMANTILIVGGTTQVSKFVEELEDRLIETIPLYCPQIERVEVVDPFEMREILPTFVQLIGAAVLPRLESTKELWITRERWIGQAESQNLIQKQYDINNSNEPMDINLDENNVSSYYLKKNEKSLEFGISVLKEKIPFQW